MADNGMVRQLTPIDVRAINDCWFVHGPTNDGKAIEWLLDTGTGMNILSWTTYQNLECGLMGPLEPSKVRLAGPSRDIHVYG